MASTQPERHPSIYLLSDHLDAALAMGEDLLTEKVALDAPARQSSPSSLRSWMRQSRDLGDFLATARTLEYAMTARLLQARKRAEELKRSEIAAEAADCPVRGRHCAASRRGCRTRRY